MKAYDELSYHGRIRRLRHQTKAALEAYGLAEAKIQFLNYSGNTAYQIDTRNCAPREPEDERYWENHYLLRLHQPHYQTLDAIQSEMQWLAALCQDTELVVPKPIPAKEGHFVVETTVPGLPAPQYATLLRWVKGRELTKNIQPRHFYTLGRVIAQLHNHSTQWRPPQDFTRPHYDWNGLFWDGGLFEFSANKLWTNIPQRYRGPFEQLTSRVRDVMDLLGNQIEVYGLIHADLFVDGNVLWYRGEVRPIDFDDTAFGYWLYDLAVPLSPWQTHKVKNEFKTALLRGYSELRSLASWQLDHLELFIGARYATEMLYAINAMLTIPQWASGAKRWLDQAAKNLLGFIAKNAITN